MRVIKWHLSSLYKKNAAAETSPKSVPGSSCEHKEALDAFCACCYQREVVALSISLSPSQHIQMMLCSPRHNRYMQNFLTIELFFLLPDIFTRGNQNPTPCNKNKHRKKD